MKWKTIELEKEFKITVPVGTNYYVSNEKSVVVFALQTTPQTEIVIGRFKFSSDGKNMKRKIFEEINLFCKTVEKKVGHRVRPVVETTFDEKTRLYMNQTRIIVDDASVWLACIFCRDASDEFFIMHWNGADDESTEIAQKIFDSFNPHL